MVLSKVWQMPRWKILHQRAIVRVRSAVIARLRTRFYELEARRWRFRFHEQIRGPESQTINQAQQRLDNTSYEVSRVNLSLTLV